MDAISAQRLNEVHPALSQRIYALDVLLKLENINIRITQGLRTWNEQNALYAQGRTSPGPIVTNAKGGYSAHNFGYAVDFVVMNGQLPDWNSEDAGWKLVLAYALKYGLAEGATWRTFPDKPHLYLSELPADPDDNMRYTFLSVGMQGLWDSWNIP